jgi:hypothetical protein
LGPSSEKTVLSGDETGYIGARVISAAVVAENRVDG